ncbi:hypothetical protein CHARACLAT_007672 [Characodon lateralis]|uniref:Uncharacterized protein n=1 Tax=Characodon lateralis TaxID=208331 RepID=A0ABU7EUM5_9TELE|nr:hypothetical protein [Characodon lateralis]
MLRKNLPFVSLKRSSSPLPPSRTSDHPPSPTVRRNNRYTLSLSGRANLCLHRCTCSPFSQIQPQPPKSSLKLPETVFTDLHYCGL